MKLYSFQNASRPIEQYDSINASVTHLTRGQEAFFLVFISLKANGVLGRHRASENQLFFVIDGTGTVSSEDGVFHPIRTGQMAFWQAGEMHETRTEHGLTAVVIEGENLEPASHLQPV
jgi:quercetin dioxygenase-like cupin family protein